MIFIPNLERWADNTAIIAGQKQADKKCCRMLEKARINSARPASFFAFGAF